MITKEQEDNMVEVFKEIQASIPPSLMANVVREEYAYPDLRKILLIAMDDPDFPEEKKKDIQVLIDSGELEKKAPVEDKKIARLIDQHVTREINKAIKAGKLPKKKDIKDLTFIKKLYEKAHSKENK